MGGTIVALVGRRADSWFSSMRVGHTGSEPKAVGMAVAFGGLDSDA